MPDVWSILFALVILQGLLVSAALFTFRSANGTGNRLLALMVLIFSLLLTEEFMEVSRLYRFAPKVLMSTFSLDMAFGPLVYLYTLSIFERNTFSKRGWHLWPLAFITGAYLLFHFGTSRGAFAWVDPAPTAQFIVFVNIKILYLIAYFLTSLRMLRRQKGSQTELPDSNRIQVSVLSIILWVLLASILFIYILFDLNILFPNTLPPSDVFTSVLITFCIYAIVFIAIRFPIVFSDIKTLEFYEKKIVSESYKTSSLTTDQKKKYLEQLLDIMDNSKLYRNQQLKTEDVAEKLGIPVHHLSQVINEVLDKNFYEFINYYRVEEVKKKMLDPGERHKSLLGIAMDAGFNSKATFNRAFKEFTGQTPSAYKAEAEKNR